MSETKNEKKNGEINVIASNLAILATPEGFQKYMLGTKKDGSPRAVYDVVKDYAKPKKKKKNKKKNSSIPKSSYSFYIDTKKKDKKKKKKNKKKNNKHWHY